MSSGVSTDGLHRPCLDAVLMGETRSRLVAPAARCILDHRSSGRHMQLPQARLSIALAGTLALGSSPGLERSSAAPARVAADSIYGLAVDSIRYREYPYVYLLDDGVVRLEKDGKSSRTY